MTTHTSTAQRSSKYPTTIGIDVGGTGMKGGLVRLGSGPKAGTLRGDRFRIPTPQPAMPEPVAATLAAITAELDGREKAPKPSAPLGVCFPSIVKDGVCLSANNIDHSWIGTDLRGTFEEHLRRPVTVVNDADAAGLAEVAYGDEIARSGPVIFLTLGTGIGSAFLLDGQLFPNTEIGHLIVGEKEAEHQASSAVKDREGLKTKQWAKRVNRVLHEYEALFNPSAFVIGGGISRKFDKWGEHLRIETPVVAAQLRNRAGIVGAAMAAQEGIRP